MLLQNLRSRWYNSTGYPSMQDYYRHCTYDKFSFAEEDNIILGPVTIPCSGSYNRGTLTFNYNSKTTCGSSEQYSWMANAEAWARAVSD